MITKEQCFIDRVLDEMEYRGNERLEQYVLIERDNQK